MYVIGTAGHVDHGKSTLVQALTGIHPDRLKEEREREMTIDLGFAWLVLPGGEELGIVDVPGHRDFIENMLAGVSGIDAALFVVAADEGVMPQTREHLAILDLLQVQGGVVALTKIDLVDQDWIELVQEDLSRALSGTVLENAPIVPVSSRNRLGIPELMDALADCVKNRPSRPDLGRPRLGIDRVFTIAGFGTVVTGTLSDGQLNLGDELEVLPAGYRGRIRGLQTHKRKEETAVPGSRTAVNISGVSLEQIQRGDVLAHPGDYLPTRRIDVHFRLLGDANQSLKHNTEVKLFIGAKEVIARVRLLGTEEIIPGDNGWLQLELSIPIVAMRGDHYILRRPSPGETLGGGIVIDPHPKDRHKRYSEDTLRSLQMLAQGTPVEIFQQALISVGIGVLKDVVARSNLDQSAARFAAQELLERDQLILLRPGRPSVIGSSAADATSMMMVDTDIIASQDLWNRITTQVIQEVSNYHMVYPLRQGIPREELKSRSIGAIFNSPKIFNSILNQLVTSGLLEENGPLIRIPGYRLQFSQQQEQSVQNLLEIFKRNPYSPPSIKECQTDLGEELFQAVLDTGILFAAAPDVVFRKEDLEKMIAEIRRLITQNGPITAAQVRDHFKTSRKYSLALLEYLDRAKITIREGDYRHLYGKKQ